MAWPMASICCSPPLSLFERWAIAVLQHFNSGEHALDVVAGDRGGALSWRNVARRAPGLPPRSARTNMCPPPAPATGRRRTSASGCIWVFNQPARLRRCRESAAGRCRAGCRQQQRGFAGAIGADHGRTTDFGDVQRDTAAATMLPKSTWSVISKTTRLRRDSVRWIPWVRPDLESEPTRAVRPSRSTWMRQQEAWKIFASDMRGAREQHAAGGKAS